MAFLWRFHTHGESDDRGVGFKVPAGLGSLTSRGASKIISAPVTATIPLPVIKPQLAAIAAARIVLREIDRPA
jgi:hypothetical protein